MHVGVQSKRSPKVFLKSKSSNKRTPMPNLNNLRSVGAVGLATVLCLVSRVLPAQAAEFGEQQGALISPNSPTDFASASFQQSLRDLAATGANAVTLVIPYYQSNIYSTDVQAGWNTPTDAALSSGIAAAHADGLQVMLAIHDDPYDGNWRAEINPGDRDGWFTAYGAVLSHYAALAQADGVEWMCLGTEMYHMTSPQVNPGNTVAWETMITNVRSLFSGQLTYSANWGAPYDEKDQIAFWNDLDAIGISAYWPLATDQGTPSVSDYVAAWASIDQSQITPLAERIGKPVLFTEVGYKSVSGAHYEPGVFQLTGAPDQQEQANLYNALFAYWNQSPILGGIYFWGWSSDPNAGGQNDTDYTPQGKEAEQVMQTAFQDGSTSSGANTEPVAPALIQVIAPSSGQNLSGTVPFEVAATSATSVYWQVDGGQLNPMFADSTGYEALVDLSGWNWQPSGQYAVEFVAENASGATVATTSVPLLVNQ
jgi:hypothetical protein